MPPRKSPRTSNNPASPPPPPPAVIDTAALNAAVATAVETAMAQYHSSDASRGGTPVESIPIEIPVRSRECSYKDFTNCKPKPFYGTGRVIALSQWFEKTESVFKICSCPAAFKVKYVASTFEDKALTWWNGHVKALTLVVANDMGWATMKDLMTEEYCPRGEVQKLEHELWNLTMKGTNVIAYTARFSELVALCPNMVPTEGKKIERYIWGLVPPYQGNVLASNPATFDSAKRLAQRLIDHGVKTPATTTTLAIPEPSKLVDTKRKFWDEKKK